MKSPSDSSDLPTTTKSEGKDCEPQIDQQAPAPAGGIEQEVHREGKRGRKDEDDPVRGPENGDPKGQSGSPQKLPRKTRMRQGRPVKAVGQVLELPPVEKRKQGRSITKEQRAEIEARMLKALPDDIPVVKMGVKGHPKITC